MPSWHGSSVEVGHSQLMKAVLFSNFFMLLNWLTSACPYQRQLLIISQFYCLSQSLVKLTSVTDHMQFEYGLYTVMCDSKGGLKEKRFTVLLPHFCQLPDCEKNVSGEKFSQS